MLSAVRFYLNELVNTCCFRKFPHTEQVQTSKYYKFVLFLDNECKVSAA